MSKSLISCQQLYALAEELVTLTNEDKKHPLHFEELAEKLVRSLSDKNKKQSKIMLEKMFDDLLDFSNYYSEKYYRAGFGDCLNLVIMSLGGASK